MSALRLDVTAGHTPIEVTAHLRTGAGFDPPYGLDLAGILAAPVRARQRQALADAGRLTSTPLPDTTEEEAEDLPLPLSRCTTAEQWHWLATCALTPPGQDAHEPRTFYRTVNSGWASTAAQRPLPYFAPKAGPYRDVMMPAPVVVCQTLRWRAVGDAEPIADLLRPLRFIGRRRHTGEGAVLRWEVQPVAADDLAGWIHHDDEGRLLRPCPTECAEALGLEFRTGWHAVRPPSWHPDRLVELAMTAQEDAW